MDEVNFKDIRVLPSSLDLKGNSSKSLSDLLGQLQSGSVLKGLVVGSTPRGEVIFHTARGRFAVPNVLGLQRGDTITIRFATEGEQISGTIMTVNNVASNSKEPLTVAFVRNSDRSQALSSKKSEPSNVILDNTNKLPEHIKGNITYLNLSSISKSSLLYKTLETSAIQNTKGVSITLKTSAPNQLLRSPLQVQGEVSGNGKDGAQLIKTNFGIITSFNTKMPIGQKMTLEVISINNLDTGINIKKEVADFMFNLNKNWASVKNISVASFSKVGEETQIPDDIEVSNSQKFSATINLSKSISKEQQQPPVKIAQGATSSAVNQEGVTQTDNVIATNTALKNTLQPSSLPANTMIGVMNKASQILGGLNIPKASGFEKNDLSTKQEIRQKGLAKAGSTMQDVRSEPKETRNISNFLKSFSNHEAIKKLSSEYSDLKELFVTNPKEESDPNSWQSIMIPFYNGQKIEEQEVKFSRPREYFMRFLIDVNLEALGKIRVDGLIKFQNDNKTPIGFDLIMRSKKALDSVLENKITDIFNFNKQKSGIKGTLSFDEEADF